MRAARPVSRPLRALVAIIALWVAGRSLFLLGERESVYVDRRGAPAAHAGSAAEQRYPSIALVRSTRATLPRAVQGAAHFTGARFASPTLVKVAAKPVGTLNSVVGVPPKHGPTPPSAAAEFKSARAGTEHLPPKPASRSRFSGSAWALSRGGSGPLPLGTGGQLGASQAGVRLFFEAVPDGLVLTGRLSAPLGQRTGREASVGFDLRNRLGGVLLERRVALERGGRNAMSVTAYGGISDVALPAGLRLDGYAQAGLVGFRSRDLFADGGFSIDRDFLNATRSRLSAGVGAWVGAQPGINRVDIGPQLTARLPVANTPLRITASYRQRVAGKATPASGPAITMGFDF